MLVMRPFPSFDAFEYCLPLLRLQDICNLGIVCKKNNECFKIPRIWQKIAEYEGMPQVVNLDGSPRESPMEDFKVLYPRTLSGREIGRFFGKVIGQVPPVSQYWFDKIDKPDPFEKEKKFGDNFRFIVKPSYIERTSTKEAPLDLDENNNLIEINCNKAVEKTLKIPFSLRNFYLLSKYRLQGEGPGFDEEGCDKTIELLTSFPERVGVDVMRLNILEESRDLSLDFQKMLLEKMDPNEGFTVTPFITRALWDVYSLLKFGTCPDRCVDGIWTYARSPDIVTGEDGIKYEFEIGCFALSEGVIVQHTGSDHDFVGISPGVSAEVTGSLTLEGLAIR